MLRAKDENELAKLGLRLDPADPTKAIPLDGPAATVPPAMSASASRAVPIGQRAGSQQTNVSDGPIALSFFSGARGLDLGLEDAGFSVRLVSEIDEDARATIVANRPDIPLIGDILDYTAAQVRAAAGIGDSDIDLIAAGPPCQPFSIAGKHLGLDDARGKLLLTFVNLASELAPRYIVVENVPRLLSDDAFDMVLAMLRSGGYAVSFNLYDAAYFGAPQRRRRLIIIASSNGSSAVSDPHPFRPSRGWAGSMANSPRRNR